MRALAALAAVAALSVGGAAQPGLSRLPLALLAPAYDSVTQSSLRNLSTALQSRAMLEGDLDDLTVAALADWGWTPQGTTAVRIEVDGAAFRVVARDVRPGASTFEVTADVSASPVAERLDRSAAAAVGLAPVAGVTIAAGSVPGPRSDGSLPGA